MLARSLTLALPPLGRIRIGYAMRRPFIIAAALLALAQIGCVSGGRRNPQAESTAEEKTPQEEMDERLNQLWEEGYGYNNPNADRIKQGLPPIPFKGE